MNIPEFQFVEFWFLSLLHSFLASGFPNRTISKWRRIVSAHANDSRPPASAVGVPAESGKVKKVPRGDI